jgi:hypothetical protein
MCLNLVAGDAALCGEARQARLYAALRKNLTYPLLHAACVWLQVTLRCALSRRQAQLYAALRKNLTLQDLVAMNSKMAAAAAAAGATGGVAAAAPVVSSSAASARLMGLIMQMRKVRGWSLLKPTAKIASVWSTAITDPQCPCVWACHEPYITEPCNFNVQCQSVATPTCMCRSVAASTCMCQSG